MTVVVFRCEGTRESGLGHVSRCLALAEAFEELGIRSHFLGHFDEAGAALLDAAGMAFEDSSALIGGDEDLSTTSLFVERARASGVVVDSYRVGDEYVSALHQSGPPVLLIDDFGRLARYECSAVVNFTVNAGQLRYPRRDQLWLLGPEYLLVRRRMRKSRLAAKVRSGHVGRALVAMGGVDVLDLSRLVVRALRSRGADLAVRVVVSRTYEFLSELSGLVAGFRGGGVVVRQVADLAEELAWADLCICGGGLTKYESAYLGVPTAVLSQTPDQAHETAHFARKRLAVDLGLGKNQQHAELATCLANLIGDCELRASLSRAGLSCFPGDPTRETARALAATLVNHR